jgi:uncharacterized protein (DUF2461 family)
MIETNGILFIGNVVLFWCKMLWNCDTDIEIQYRTQNSDIGSKFRCRNRSSYSEIEIRNEISMSKSKYRLWHRNFVKISILSILKDQNRNRNSDFKIEIEFWKIEASKYFGEIRIKFRRNLDFFNNKKGFCVNPNFNSHYQWKEIIKENTF